MIEWVLIIVIHFNFQANYTLEYNSTHFDDGVTCEEMGKELVVSVAKLFDGSLAHHKHMRKVEYTCE